MHGQQIPPASGSALNVFESLWDLAVVLNKWVNIPEEIRRSERNYIQAEGFCLLCLRQGARWGCFCQVEASLPTSLRCDRSILQHMCLHDVSCHGTKTPHAPDAGKTKIHTQATLKRLTAHFSCTMACRFVSIDHRSYVRSDMLGLTSARQLLLLYTPAPAPSAGCCCSCSSVLQVCLL
jgi:hypothetical protein